MNIITEQMETAYLEAEGTECPYCKSSELKSETITREDFSGCHLSLQVECRNCHKVWHDSYHIQLVDIDEAE
jgi:uncharacterized Zn finger protein